MPRERAWGKGPGRHSAAATDVTMPAPEETKRFHPAPRTMDRAAFVAKFGGVYEHFPQIAKVAWAQGLDASTDTPDGLATAMAEVASALDSSDKLKLIRNHPDLAGRVAMADLTASSRSEQTGAGLDRCSPEEFQRFQELNRVYKEKFAFPFLLAVAGKSRHEILAAFQSRVENDRETEFQTALEQIDKIARIRLEALAV
jgi:2-oxo-4-hydroxy-4-carboxy-5-ureidoimidazoline decarboxylase